MLNKNIAMKVVILLSLISCLTYASKEQHPKSTVIIGSGDHDYKVHKSLIGGGDHDYKVHKSLIGSGDHDYKIHKSLIGGGDHDYKAHKSLIGGGNHDYKAHKSLIGGGNHDYKAHKSLIGGGDHDYKPHKVLFGGGDHDKKSHLKKIRLAEDKQLYKQRKKTLLGSGDHDKKTHGKALLGSGDHDMKPHGKKLLGGDDHDKKVHGRVLLGGGDHDKKTHGKALLGSGDHDKKTHGKVLLGGGDHDKKVHGKTLIGGSHDYFYKKKSSKKLLGRGKHDYFNHGKRAEKFGHLTAFGSFIQEHNRTYSNEREYKKRFSIFRNNMKKVKFYQENEKATATYGITKFADLTQTEFRKLLGFRPHTKPAVSTMQKAKIPNFYEMPTEFDWRNSGVVTPVKNQGQCGSCWAFSTTGNVEGQWAIKHKALYSLSEQELVDCDKSDSGCNGGLPENAYQAIEDIGGLETEGAYPYEGHDDQCHVDKSKFKVQVNGSVELPQDERDLAAWLVKNGPISIGINANPLQFYVGGVSHPLKFLCNPEKLDHGMLIVGYGVHTTKYLHRRQPYWLIKNSWGTTWGEKGYYRVYRGDGTCGVNRMATSAIVP